METCWLYNIKEDTLNGKVSCSCLFDELAISLDITSTAKSVTTSGNVVTIIFDRELTALEADHLGDYLGVHEG